MKKILSLALVVVLVVAMAAGCAQKSEPATAPPANEPATGESGYKDGTYTAKGEADERGWTPEVTVVVKDGKISEVKYDEARAMNKSEDAEYIKTFKDAKNVDIVSVYKQLGESLVAAQDAEKVAAVSGATTSSTNFKTLAAEAMAQAKDGDNLKDGTYKATGKTDERGWTPYVTITVAEGKITAATYDEASSSAVVYKSQDEAYKSSFKQIKNVDVAATYEKFANDLIASQDITKVDVTGGATHSGENFKTLVEKALSQAK
ncbi:FMN-binding protein [Lutispora thermophila]|uniref:Major membrane immunogen, membrane-anchored lipoprotein n=1 Tax=Lutispora thermophila DSM 19022 TaxID=1122184 RepID=A0A1M6BRH0_9FIRM|nr:FMN-binding protein [Lutispora thermophila]SHI51183.1 Major membrane immunogen, membrane-anchored lipoprotein [Lutispora thermophila DSM 19022]